MPKANQKLDSSLFEDLFCIPVEDIYILYMPLQGMIMETYTILHLRHSVHLQYCLYVQFARILLHTILLVSELAMTFH